MTVRGIGWGEPLCPMVELLMNIKSNAPIVGGKVSGLGGVNRLGRVKDEMQEVRRAVSG